MSEPAAPWHEALNIPVDPDLPENFDDTPNEDRPASHAEWWGKPYVQSYRSKDKRFLEAWPNGVRYDIRCLDGGAWDRSTWKGSYATLDEAMQAVQNMEDVATFGDFPGASA